MHTHTTHIQHISPHACVHTHTHAQHKRPHAYTHTHLLERVQNEAAVLIAQIALPQLQHTQRVIPLQCLEKIEKKL